MKTAIRALFVFVPLAAVLVVGAPSQQGHCCAEQRAAVQGPEGKAAARVGDHYTLGTCPISGKKLGAMGDPVVKLYAGREIRFCCGGCTGRFEKDLDANLAKVDSAIIADQLPLYPLTTSVVSGEKLPANAVDVIHGNRLVRLGTDKEKEAFSKEPGKYLALLDKAVIAAQGKDYVFDRCPVSDDEYGSEADRVDVVIGGRLVRLSCGGCAEAVHQNPLKYVQMVDAARKQRSEKAGRPANESTPGK